MNNFASRLLRARAEAGMTQRELSDAAGVSTVQLSRYESGKSSPRAPVLVKLANALKVNTDWLGGDYRFDKDATISVELSFPPDAQDFLRQEAAEYGVPPELMVSYYAFVGTYRMHKEQGIKDDVVMRVAHALERQRQKINSFSKKPLVYPLDEEDQRRVQLP